MHIIMATTSYSTLSDIAEAHKQLSIEQKALFKVTLYNLEDKMTEERWEQFKLAARSATFFLYDPHGVDGETIDTMASICAEYDMNQVSIMVNSSERMNKYLKLGVLRGQDIELDHRTGELKLHTRKAETVEPISLIAEKNEALQQYMKLLEYWRASGVHNWRQLIYYLGRSFGSIDFPSPIEPTMFEDLAIVDPKTSIQYKNVKSYAADASFDQEKPIVAVFYLSNHSRLYTAGVVAEIVDKIKVVANVIPIGLASSMKVNVAKLRQLLTEAGYKVGLIINFLGFRLGGGPRSDADAGVVELLEELGVPVLHPFFLSRMQQEEWEQSTRGISASEHLVHIVLPELDGNIETYPVAAMKEKGFDDQYHIGLKELAIIEERVDHLVKRIQKWLTLRAKPNDQKKVALICYNYPPGEGNLFGGAFLDTFASVSHLLTRLKEDNYDVEPVSPEKLQKYFIEGNLVNSGKWVAEQAEDKLIRYEKENYDQQLAVNSMKQEITDKWGASPGTVMTENDRFLIPGMCNGKLFIGLQPTRGIHENPEMVYHDDQLPPPHQYAAYYQWLREEFKADVIIHVGTHGTLEFLPGKESGMSGHCFPDQFIADIPHLYYYYVGNPSEGMIAKRRSHAALISYQAPPFVEGQLYGEYVELERFVHEYREAKQLDPDRCKYIWTQMKEIMERLGLDSEHFEQVEDELYRMSRSMIPHGLHVLGEGFSQEDAIKHMAFVLRHDRTEAPALRRLLAAARDMDYDQLMDDNDINQLALLDKAALETVEAYIQKGELPKVSSELASEFQKTLAFGRQAYEATLNNEEIEGMLQALRGQYITANLSGDVMRNPSILPTGRNMYQLDPRSVPSEAAVKKGMEIANNTVQLYYNNTGKYPHTTALVMWGIETARTQGETVGQILHYLGVSLGNRKNSFQPVFEIIPLHELGRPRLNIVINISGIFRDMFPNIIDELNVLFKRIALLDEPEEQNLFKQQTNQMLQHLLEEGYSREDALDLACARIFGPAEGEYGTGVTSMIETKNWTDEEQIGDMYNKHLHHIYSSNRRGEAMGELFNVNLAAVEIVSQLRSNHEHEVVDIDHYYEYFGGLSKTIESIKGVKAEVYITDTTGEKVLTEDVRESINRGVRTRMLNPKWIDALLEHPYHGAQQIAQRFENVLGLAATTNKVEQWVFSALHETYVADEIRSKQLEENNRYAYHEMLETLLECSQRQYWNPTDEQLEQLQHKYMQLEGEIES